MPKTIIIDWRTSDGASFAHFPEPFPMSAAEWAAFAGIFDRLGFLPDSEGDVRAVSGSPDAPRRLSDAIMELGYCVEHRGDVPASILK